MPIQAEQDIIVLVMNPHDEDATLITSTLEKAGYQVTTCSGVKELAELCHASQSSLRLVIVDPSTVGLRMSELLLNNPDVRFLVVGSDDALDHMSREFAKNIRGTLRKPFRRTRFLGSVLEAVGGFPEKTASAAHHSQSSFSSFF
jgi:CheY-like chemotaxis protein